MPAMKGKNVRTNCGTQVFTKSMYNDQYRYPKGNGVEKQRQKQQRQEAQSRLYPRASSKRPRTFSHPTTVYLLVSKPDLTSSISPLHLLSAHHTSPSTAAILQHLWSYSQVFLSCQPESTAHLLRATCRSLSWRVGLCSSSGGCPAIGTARS